jgi:hypothetical protein
MKKCPKCDRTFEDSFSFCLEDGTVLSSSLDDTNEQVTAIINKPAPEKNTFWKVGFIGLLLVLIFGSGFGVILFFMNPDDIPTEPGKQTKSVNRNSAVGETVTAATPSPTMTATPAETAATATPAENSSAGKLDEAVAALKQEMAYDEARRVLIDAGWQAVVRSPNREKFGSEEYIFDQLKFYEVESCSGTGMGFCRFLFRDIDNRQLVIVTANNEEGVEGGPVVNNWFFDK